MIDTEYQLLAQRLSKHWQRYKKSVTEQRKTGFSLLSRDRAFSEASIYSRTHVENRLQKKRYFTCFHGEKTTCFQKKL